MASGLQNKPYKSYREILGLKPLNTSKQKVSRRVGNRTQLVEQEQVEQPDFEVDLYGEQDLVGDDPSALSMEEGELSDEELVELAEEDLDTDQILSLAAAEEQRCQELVQCREREEEEELLRQEQEHREALLKLKVMRSKRQSLEVSLSSLPSVTGSRQFRRQMVAKQVQGSGTMSAPKAKLHYAIPTRPMACHSSVHQKTIQQGESVDLNCFAHELLDSVKQLKDGKTAPFSLLRAKAMSGQARESPSLLKRADSLPNVFLEPRETGEAPREQSGTSEGVMPKVVGEVTMPLIKTEQTGQGNGVACSSHADLLPQQGEVQGVGSVNSKDKNLKSGKTRKPDEVGIKCIVQYAHEKLNSVHVHSRVFNDLSFHFLVAGELEMLLQDCMDPGERWARLHFLRTLCYHKEYVDIEDL